MENHARLPIIVLRIEISSKESSELLEKHFLRINGVHQVAISREKDEVTVIGDVDPSKLVKYIAKMGRKVELLKYEKPKNRRENHAENCFKNAHDSKDKHPNGSNRDARQSGIGCPDGHPHCKVRGSFYNEKCCQSSKDETLMEGHGQNSFRKDDNYRAAARESGEKGCRDEHGQFYSVHNDKYQPGKKVEEETFRDPHGQFHSVHYDKYRSASMGVEEEVCPDQYAQFHGRSGNAKGSVPPMKNEGEKYYDCPDNHPNCNMEHSAHHDNCQFYGRSRSTSGFVPPRNTDKDSKYCSFSDDHHPHHAASKGNQEEMGWGGYERTRNGNYNYARPRYNEDMCGNNKDHPHPKGYTFREPEIEEVIKEAKQDMDRFFNGIRGRSDHFPVGISVHHHGMPTSSGWMREEPKPDFEFRGGPSPFEQHRERMPPPISPPRVYRGRFGNRYDKFTNFFSDENPSSCTII